MLRIISLNYFFFLLFFVINRIAFLYACTQSLHPFPPSTLNKRDDDASPLHFGLNQLFKKHTRMIKREENMTHMPCYISCHRKAVWGTTDKCHVNNMMMMMLWRWLLKVG